jgi:glycosyltransferase involved in cell wall biosynthesis
VSQFRVNEVAAPTLSVVVPAHDAAGFIAETLESIAAQTRPPDRIVVVDDGSRDGTAGRVRAWAASCVAIPVLLIEQENRGVSAARNAGIRAAGTDLVALVDADDLILPDHLRTVTDVFGSHPEVVLAFADACQFEGAFAAAAGGAGDGGKVVKPSLLAGAPLLDRPAEAAGPGGVEIVLGSPFGSLLADNHIPTSAVVLRRDAALAAGLFDEAMPVAEDWDLWLRMALLGSFAYSRRVLAAKRIHGSNLTRPENVLRFLRANLGMFRRLAADDRIRRDPDMAGAVQAARTRTARQMLWYGSLGGPRLYLGVCRDLAGERLFAPLCNPRHAARAFIRAAG